MPKNNAIAKRLKISKAQKNMLAAVAGAAFVLGISLVFAVYFLKYIKFNATVISEKDKAIEGYSKAIKDIGICKAPSGKVYNTSELKACDPNDPDMLSKVPGSLRYEVIMNLSQNEALESVGRTGLAVCYDSTTNQKRSVDELIQKYRVQTDEKEQEYYLELIGMCSSLRVIPDALPSIANPLALGASLDRIFKLSYYEPEGITPGNPEESDIAGVGALGVSLTVEGDVNTTMTVLNNLEKSIREINIKTARIEKNGDSLKLNASAMAYYTETASLNEVVEVVRGDGRISRDAGDEK